VAANAQTNNGTPIKRFNIHQVKNPLQIWLTHMVHDSTIHPRTIPIVGIQSGVTDGRVDNQLFMFIIIIYQVNFNVKRDREQFILKIYLTYIKHKNIKNIRSLNK
jgi:hypothetical protein